MLLRDDVGKKSQWGINQQQLLRHCRSDSIRDPGFPAVAFHRVVLHQLYCSAAIRLSMLRFLAAFFCQLILKLFFPKSGDSPTTQAGLRLAWMIWFGIRDPVIRTVRLPGRTRSTNLPVWVWMVFRPHSVSKEPLVGMVIVLCGANTPVIKEFEIWVFSIRM